MGNCIFQIPELTVAELKYRYSCVVPFLSLNGQKHFCRKLSVRELLTLSLSSPVSELIDKPVDNNYSLDIVKKICTIHPYSHNGICLPSVAEVLAQIPSEFFPNAFAFEITDWLPQTEEAAEDPKDITANLHIAETTLFLRK